MRLQINRRRDVIQKKEINIMEWAKKNHTERTKNEKEKQDLDEQRDSLLQEELILKDKLKRLKKREFEELVKKAKVIEGKRDMLKNIK